MFIPTSTNNQPWHPRYCHLIHRIEAIVIRFLCCNGTRLDRLIMDIAPWSLGGHGGDGTSLVGFFIALSFGNGLRHRGNILHRGGVGWLCLFWLVGWLAGWLAGWQAVFFWCTYFSTTLNNRGCFQNSWTNHVEIYMQWRKEEKSPRSPLFLVAFNTITCVQWHPTFPPFKGWPVADAQVVHIHDAKSRRSWSQIFGSWHPQSVERHDVKSVEIIWLNNNLFETNSWSDFATICLFTKLFTTKKCLWEMHQCICGCETFIVSSWNIIHHTQPKGQLHIGLFNILTSLHRSCLVPAGEKLLMPQFYKDLWLERIESINVHPCSISFMQFFAHDWPEAQWFRGKWIWCVLFPGSHGALSTACIADAAKSTETGPHVEDESSQDLLEEAARFLMWFDNKVDHLQILQPMSNHLVSNGAE